MDRIGFLLPGGRRVDCLLNPEDIQVSRTSGVQAQRTIGASQWGAGDPVQRTSGGTTRLSLKLLFDVMLQGVRATDVRELTEPLWELADAAGSQMQGDDKVRFMWGKSWNVPGSIESLSERLEQFTSGGAPRRAWITMSFIADVAPQSLRKDSLRGGVW